MIVNTKLLKHPMNYVIVTLMLVIADIAGHLVMTWIGGEPAAAPLNNTGENSTPSTIPVNLRKDGTFQVASAGQ